MTRDQIIEIAARGIAKSRGRDPDAIIVVPSFDTVRHLNVPGRSSAQVQTQIKIPAWQEFKAEAIAALTALEAAGVKMGEPPDQSALTRARLEAAEEMKAKCVEVVIYWCGEQNSTVDAVRDIPLTVDPENSDRSKA